LVLTSVCVVSRYRVAMTAAAARPPGGPGRPPFADASPARVRAALIPEEAAEFDRQWREAMTRATESQDLTEVLELLEGWRRVAWMTTEAGPEAHRRMYRSAAARLTGQDIPAGEALTRTKARLGL
jgi:hypothetical protein